MVLILVFSLMVQIFPLTLMVLMLVVSVPVLSICMFCAGEAGGGGGAGEAGGQAKGRSACTHTYTCLCMRCNG